jgi:hypothetical protein
MNKNIEKLKGFRLYLLKQIEGLTAEQLNAIPAGHNNNIIWNLAHLMSAQQAMCYTRSGLPPAVDNKYTDPYLTGTRPEGIVSEQEIATLKELFINSIDQLQLDAERKIFQAYQPSVMIPQVYGFEVSNISEAIDYLLYHEGLHTGSILSLKRLV